MIDMDVCMAYLLIFIRLSSIISITDGVVLLVTRRLTGDTYAPTKNNSNVILCRDNKTFLVSERRCIRNEELFNDCSFAIAVSKEHSSYRLTLSIDHPKFNDTQIITAATFISPNNLTESAVIITKQMNQTISNHCRITSLEVYRGNKQSTVINHCGFSLSDMGEVEINRTRLRYSFEEYLGELYRMNLSCSEGDQGLPESGCMFFKIGGTADITKSKFDTAIEGSVEYKETTLPVTSTTYQMTSPSTTNSKTLLSDPTATTTEVDIQLIEVGSTLFYIVIGAGSGVLVLLLIIMIMCVSVCYLIAIRGKSYAITTDATVHGQQIQSEDRDNDPEWQWQSMATEILHQTLSSTYNTSIGENERVSEHLYAEIREANASSPSPPPLPPPLMTESMDDVRTTEENPYEANLSIPSYLKWPSNRVSRAAELAYLYEGQDADFELPFYPKRPGVKDAVDSLYDDPTSLSLTPAPRRIQSSHQKAIQGQSHDDGVEAEEQLSYYCDRKRETSLL